VTDDGAARSRKVGVRKASGKCHIVGNTFVAGFGRRKRVRNEGLDATVLPDRRTRAGSDHERGGTVMGFINPPTTYAKRPATGPGADPSFGARSSDSQRAVVTALNGHPAPVRGTGGTWSHPAAKCTSVQTARQPGSALADIMPSVFDGLPVPRDLNAVVDYLRSVGHPAETVPGALNAKPGITALFSSYFTAVMEQAPHLTGASADAAMQTLMQLASAVRDVAPPEEEPSRGMRARRIEAVRQFVEDNLHRSDLTPARAARALGMSVRQLHLLFEPSDTSFSRYMLTRRLERARSLLAQHANRSVLDIMLACGIESSTVFYRGFRKAYGMNPTDYRRTLSDRS
jgi:AraC-like DNA-binding protein